MSRRASKRIAMTQPKDDSSTSANISGTSSSQSSAATSSGTSSGSSAKRRVSQALKEPKSSPAPKGSKNPKKNQSATPDPDPAKPTSIKKAKIDSDKNQNHLENAVVPTIGSPSANLDPSPEAPIRRRATNHFHNIAAALNSRGTISMYEVERRSRVAVMDQISQFKVYKSVTPFSRRVTAIAWHYKEPTLCAVGSKGGDLLLWNYSRDEFQSLITGIGPGGSIQGLKFDSRHANRVYTCSIDGTFGIKDFGSEQPANVFLNTHNWDKWYTSFDVSDVGGTLMVGDNNGNVTLLTQEGEVVWQNRLHKSKVTNIQFSPREPWLVITTSTDNTVKVWDIRNLGHSTPGKSAKDMKNQWLHSLEHDKAVNSAYFNPLDGTRLLTTDQHSQLRVYRAPFWDLSKTIPHPHRQFQHLTPIRATWHPLVDVIVAGRYPDANFPGFVPGETRTIDCIDADTGETMAQILEPGLNKISSLNQFSRNGDAMLSGMAQTILIWKPKPDSEDESVYKKKASNVDELEVEEWPGYKPPPKANNKLAKAKGIARP